MNKRRLTIGDVLARFEFMFGWCAAVIVGEWLGREGIGICMVIYAMAVALKLFWPPCFSKGYANERP